MVATRSFTGVPYRFSVAGAAEFAAIALGTPVASGSGCLPNQPHPASNVAASSIGAIARFTNQPSGDATRLSPSGDQAS